jgi:hypothetical protein
MLIETHQLCKYSTIIHFLQRLQGAREFINWQFKEEKKKRSVKTGKGNLFFFD